MKYQFSLGDKILLFACVISFCSGLVKLGVGVIGLLFIDFLLLLSLCLKLPIIINNLKKCKAYGLSFIILVLSIAAICGIFNSNVKDVFFALKGLRVSIFLFIYFFIGIAIGLRTDLLSTLGRLLGVLVCINILGGMMELLFPYNALFYNLIKWEFGENLAPLFTVRVTGLLVGPVQFALSCGFLFFYSVNKFLFQKRKCKFLFLGVFAFIGLIISKSRAVLFAVLGLLLLLLFNKHIDRKLKINVLLLLSFFVVGIFLFIYLYLDSESISILVNRYLGAFDSDSVTGSSFKEGRINRWVVDVFPAIEKLPLGGGTGFTQSFGDGADMAYRIKPILTESIYFDVFVELGWGIGILFMSFVIYCSRIILKKLCNSTDVATLVCCLTVMLLFIPGITSPNMAAFPFTYLCAICLGILLVRNMDVKYNVVVQDSN